MHKDYVAVLKLNGLIEEVREITKSFEGITKSTEMTWKGNSGSKFREVCKNHSASMSGLILDLQETVGSLNSSIAEVMKKK